MDIGHDPDPAPFSQSTVTHPADLSYGIFINDLRIAKGGIYFSFYFKHGITYVLSFDNLDFFPDHPGAIAYALCGDRSITFTAKYFQHK